MSDETRRTTGVQQGPRSQRVIREVRRATLSELARVGYANLTINAVAEAAGVHRTTLYRRWPSKQDLVADLLEPELDRLRSPVSLGDLRSDLTAAATRLANNMTTPTGRALSRLFAASEPELLALSERTRARAQSVLNHAFTWAIERGEIAPSTDVEVLGHLLFAGVVQWSLTEDAELDTARVERFVDAIVRACRAPEA